MRSRARWPRLPTPLDDATITNVVAYIATLPDSHARHDGQGDAGRARRITRPARTATALTAQGLWATNAPRLAGMSDWYMARQLQHFRQGHRGRHPQDFHGAQMARMSKIVSDGQATDDLLAYINTLH